MSQCLFFDYETFSLVNLKEVGVDNYTKHPSTGVSCLSWTLDQDEVKTWIPAAEPPPTKLLIALRSPRILKIAWNAVFEHLITNRVTGPRYILEKLHVPLSEYRDPIVLAHNISLPGKLEKVAQILKMQNQKDPRGDDLKDMFCAPVSMGGEQTLFGISPPLFRDHISHPKDFADYVKYNQQDVIAMRDLWYYLCTFPFPDIEWKGWLLNEKINQFGIPGRRDLAEKGLRLALRFVTSQKVLLKQKTGLENPNSDPQMKTWAAPRGYPWESLRAETVRAELKNSDSKLTPECREVLKLRLSARRISQNKIVKFLKLLSSDDRLRNQFRYMGAPRTGRWASSGGDEDSSMQVQNLSRGEKIVKKNLELALELLDQEDYEGIVAKFTNTPDPKDSITVVDVIITLLRSIFQAKPGHKIIVADKNAIENRMLGWAAACPAITNVFRTCNDCGYLVTQIEGSFLCPKCGCQKSRCPYLSFGTYLYSKTYEEMRASYDAGNKDERQNSKPPVLGGGYGLGGGEMYINEYGDEGRGGLWGYALKVCDVDMPKDLAHKAIDILRKSWPEVVQFWVDLEEAFKQVLIYGGTIAVGQVMWNKQQRKWTKHPTKGTQCVITFSRITMPDGCYTIQVQLPSGRSLYYLNATLEVEPSTFIDRDTGEKRSYTKRTIFYDGVEHSMSKNDSGKAEKRRFKWGRVKTYGGKICENVIQAMSRDDLLNSCFLADEMGFDIWGLFHDEIAVEVFNGTFGLRLEDLIWCMVQVPSWAPGLQLGAEGYEGPFYRKE